MADEQAPARTGKYGPSIYKGKLRYLSVSQITTFDPDQEGGCPRRWAFKYLFGKKEPTTEALQRGGDIAKVLEHYLKTGEDTLPPILRAGKHFLPKPGPDLEVERELGRDVQRALLLREQLIENLRSEPTDEILDLRGELVDQIRVFAGLTANTVPVVGAADFRHRRGEYIDSFGALKPETEGVVVEIGDHKSTARISDHVSRNGVVYQGYAKTVEQVLAHPQMVGYGVHASRLYPDATHIRLSHIYYQTRNGYASAKRTGLITVDEIRRRWQRVEHVARDMEQVADLVHTGGDIEQVEANPESCVAYGRPCPHSEYCSRPNRTLNHVLGIPQGNSQEEETMSKGLFSMLSGDAPQNGAVPHVPVAAPVAPPPAPTVDREAQVALAKARMIAEEAKAYGFCRGCGEGLSATNASRLPDGSIRHFGCRAAVNPSDGPRQDTLVAGIPVAAAAPLPPDVVESIENPQIQVRAAAHAAAAAPPVAASGTPAAQAAKKVGRCPVGGTTVELSADALFTKKFACPYCGKQMKIAPEKDASGRFMMAVPSHNIPRHDDEAPAAAPPAVPAAPPPAPVAAAPAIPAAPPPPAPVAVAPVIPAAPTAPAAAPAPPAAPPPPAAPAAVQTSASSSEEAQLLREIATALREIANHLRVVAYK